ncbi:MAG: endonuclease/exonuclease/phosphatase family protein [Clostridiales bacterium]|nr:endonuclease/exonuclease/phosphatase family protein [Clostridiales bacterium]
MYKVLSTNVLCWGDKEHSIEKRIPLVIKMLRNQMPDSFGVQEAHIEWMNALCKGLPEYNYVGVGREDGKEDGEFSAVFYLKDKFSASESGNFWLSETPDVPSLGWDARCIRIATFVKLTDKITGESYVHFNTHLDHIGINAQINGAKMIQEKAASFGGVPVVCTGDFNVEQGSQCYKTMISANLGDARTMAPITDDCYTFHAFEPEKVQTIIDFIFVDKATVDPLTFKVINEKIDNQFYSDHYAVVSEIELKK